MTPEITHKSVLENGIRVLTHPMEGSRWAAIGILIECGTRDEAQGEHGLAQLTERVLFQGAGRRSGLEIAREIARTGGECGGVTSRDYTLCFARVGCENVGPALELLADVVQNPVFPAEDIEMEKRVILREMEMVRDTPARLAREQLLAGVWGEHALGRPVAGSPKALKRLDRNSIASFHERHYRPGRIIVSAAGPLSHESFVTRASDCFWRLKGETTPRLPNPGLWREATMRAALDSRQSYFCVGLPAAPCGHPGRHLFDLLDRVLGGGTSSRLYRRLRNELGLVYDVRSEYLSYRDGGMWMVEGTAAPEFEQQAVSAVLEQLEDLGDRGVDEEELWIAKRKIHCRLAMGSQDPYRVMRRSATQETYFGKTIPLDLIRHSVDRVGQEQIASAAEQYLCGSLPEAGVVCVGPGPASGDRAIAAAVGRLRRRRPRHVQ